jgi:N-acyl-phosphatidylethanolamine-hydrolysing phospholipase D
MMNRSGGSQAAETSYVLPMSRLLAISVASLFSMTCADQSPPSSKPHHTENGFQNVDVSENHGFIDLLKWRWGRNSKDVPPPESYNFPLADNDPAFLKSNRNQTTLTWIGHATVLLQLNGNNILTDPVFSERASPVQWAGPKRVVAPGLAIRDLPPIHLVVISHDHYDHLDAGSIRSLYEREGGKETFFFVPLGLKRWMSNLGITRVFEFDWWDQHEEGTLRVTAVPVQHWSKRGFFGRNKTLWAGWVIQSGHFRFFFSADSGYTTTFKDIGEKLGPFDLSAIPIGAYEPRWFMKTHHMNPEEAQQVHIDIRSKKSVAIHWGTFILTDEPLDEPPKRLQKAMKEKNIPSEDFLVLKHGETIVLSDK